MMKRKTSTYYPNQMMFDMGDSRPITYHARAAAVIAGSLAVGVFVLLALMRISTIVAMKSAGAVGVLTFSLFASYWTYRTIVDQMPKRIKNWIQDAELDMGYESESVVENETTPKSSQAAALDRLARVMIEREYIDKLPTTREACEAIGIANQGEWNQVNNIFKLVGIKSARAWTPVSYDEAIRTYRSRVILDGTTILVKKGANEWTRLNISKE